MIHIQISKYRPIWEALKRDKICRITAPTIHHRKIIKMVRRRRDKDTAYLYELAERNKVHEIKASIAGTVITFTLKESITYHGL